MTSAESSSRTAFHSGRWLSSDALTLPISDLALTQGVCAVERIRSYGGRLFRLPDHLMRWESTLAGIRLTGFPSSKELAAILDELQALNRDWIQATGEFGVMLIGSPGGGEAATLIADLYPIDGEVMRERVQAGSPLVMTPVQQPPNESWSRGWKVRCRLHYYLADAHARGYSDDALGVLMDQDGTVTETSIANLLVVEGSTLISPDPIKYFPVFRCRLFVNWPMRTVSDGARNASRPSGWSRRTKCC